MRQTPRLSELHAIQDNGSLQIESCQLKSPKNLSRFENNIDNNVQNGSSSPLKKSPRYNSDYFKRFQNKKMPPSSSHIQSPPENGSFGNTLLFSISEFSTKNGNKQKNNGQILSSALTSPSQLKTANIESPVKNNFFSDNQNEGISVFNDHTEIERKERTRINISRETTNRSSQKINSGSQEVLINQLQQQQEDEGNELRNNSNSRLKVTFPTKSQTATPLRKYSHIKIASNHHIEKRRSSFKSMHQLTVNKVVDFPSSLQQPSAFSLKAKKQQILSDPLFNQQSKSISSHNNPYQFSNKSQCLSPKSTRLPTEQPTPIQYSSSKPYFTENFDCLSSRQHIETQSSTSSYSILGGKVSKTKLLTLPSSKSINIAASHHQTSSQVNPNTINTPVNSEQTNINLISHQVPKTSFIKQRKSLSVSRQFSSNLQNPHQASSSLKRAQYDPRNSALHNNQHSIVGHSFQEILKIIEDDFAYLRKHFKNDGRLYLTIEKLLEMRHSTLAPIFVKNSKKQELNDTCAGMEEKVATSLKMYHLQQKSSLMRLKQQFQLCLIYLPPEGLLKEIKLFRELIERLKLQKISNEVRELFTTISATQQNVFDKIMQLNFSNISIPLDIKNKRHTFSKQQQNLISDRIKEQQQKVGGFKFVNKEQLFLEQQIDIRLGELQKSSSQYQHPESHKKNNNNNHND